MLNLCILKQRRHVHGINIQPAAHSVFRSALLNQDGNNRVLYPLYKVPYYKKCILLFSPSFITCKHKMHFQTLNIIYSPLSYTSAIPWNEGLDTFSTKLEVTVPNLVWSHWNKVSREKTVYANTVFWVTTWIRPFHLNRAYSHPSNTAGIYCIIILALKKKKQPNKIHQQNQIFCRQKRGGGWQKLLLSEENWSTEMLNQSQLSLKRKMQ